MCPDPTLSQALSRKSRLVMDYCHSSKQSEALTLTVLLLGGSLHCLISWCGWAQISPPTSSLPAVITQWLLGTPWLYKDVRQGLLRGRQWLGRTKGMGFCQPPVILPGLPFMRCMWLRGLELAEIADSAISVCMTVIAFICWMSDWNACRSGHRLCRDCFIVCLVLTIWNPSKNPVHHIVASAARSYMLAND